MRTIGTKNKFSKARLDAPERAGTPRAGVAGAIAGVLGARRVGNRQLLQGGFEFFERRANKGRVVEVRFVVLMKLGENGLATRENFETFFVPHEAHLLLAPQKRIQQT